MPSIQSFSNSTPRKQGEYFLNDWVPLTHKYQEVCLVPSIQSFSNPTPRKQGEIIEQFSSKSCKRKPGRVNHPLFTIPYSPFPIPHSSIDFYPISGLIKAMSVGILTLTLYLPDCHSLKAKRRLIKPILARLHKEFNVSVVEYDHLDSWQSSQLMVACASNQGVQAEKTLLEVIEFFESHWPDLPLTDEKIEIII